MIKIAVPNKGRVYDPTVKVLEKAGLQIKNKGSDRKLFANTSDEEIMLLFARTSDIPEYVQDNAADLGITSMDFIEEKQADVEVLLDLEYGKAEIVFAAPEKSDIKETKDVKDSMKIVTEFPSITSRFFKEKGINPDIIEVSGATEMTPQVGIADGIVDLTSTGTTLRMNRLSVIEKIIDTSVHLIANKGSIKDNEQKIKEVKTALESVLRGEKKQYIMMNVPEKKVEEVKGVLPGLSGPTVMRVESEKNLVAIHAVVDKSSVYGLINNLKEVGAQDILVTSIDRIVP